MTKIQVRRVLAAVSVVCVFMSALFVVPLSARAQDGESVSMTLLHNNDGESKLLPNLDSGFPGIARFTQTLQDLGTASDADILVRVTSGDNFLASKEFAAGLNRGDKPLYDALALSGLYEAMGLGNHDFDFGPDITARFISDFSPQVTFLASNIDVSGEPALQALADAGRIAPSVVVEDSQSGLEVGIIGALTPRLPNISSPRNVQVNADVAAAVNAEAARLVDEGINRIILVSHLQGLSSDEGLVPLLKNIDIVVAGGGDELLANPGDTCMPDEEPFAPYPLVWTDVDGKVVPVVTAPGGYRCIGRLDVVFDADGNLTSWEGGPVGVALDGAQEAYALDNIETPLSAAVAELSADVIGKSDVDLDGRKPSVRTGPTNIGELMADALLAAGQQAPDFGGQAATVGVQNAGGIRNDSLIPAGEISAATTFDIAPFSNFAVTLEVTRERFKEMLEVGVAGLPDAEGTYPQIAGFTMAVDPAQAGRQVDSEGDCSLIGDEGSRVRSVTLDDGTAIVQDGAVVPGDPVILATIDFLAKGGDCYPLGDLEFTRVGVSYQQALAQYISNELSGAISGDTYPQVGTRTTIGDAPAQSDPPAEETPAADPSTDTSSTEDLPNTGVESWMYLVAAATIAAGGAMVLLEARRASALSLGNRLNATRAWFPGRDKK